MIPKIDLRLHPDDMTRGPMFGPGQHMVYSWRDVDRTLFVVCSCGWKAELYERFWTITELPGTLLTYYHAESQS